ncbi:MAG: succinate dehydrogenase/fumarate reductase iron-sulfur subunit [Bacteroidota bacterium]
MRITFKIWRQNGPDDRGEFRNYKVDGLTQDMSFLEALDHLNESLVLQKKEVISFEHDCREGICGQCGIFINGRAHGPHDRTTTCQLHMRSFNDGDTITVEPWRAKAFPVIKDLIVDRSAFDRIMIEGAFISAKTGTAPEANSILIPKDEADKAMDAAACIGCGACVAACKNASASLFTAAKINHLNSLPQGKPEQQMRISRIVKQMESEGFGGCSFSGACEVECPEGISIANIAEMHNQYIKTQLFG